MKDLILFRGMDKKAEGEEGPSLEQQFGIITNSKIVEKFPQLDNMKLAFQIIDKNDEATNAVGVMAYLIGKCVVYVPSIYRNGDVNTGDIMFVAQTQQFLPLSDPWLAWIRSKGLADVAELVPKEGPQPKGGPGNALTTDYVNGIGKRASVLNEPGMADLLDMASSYVKSIGKLNPESTHQSPGITDMAMAMGKEAAGNLCEEMSKSANDLNMFLAFYSPEQLDAFEKKASAAFCQEPKKDEIVLPFTEEAKGLDKEASEQLAEVGWFIKKAEEDRKDKPVIKDVSATKLFSSICRTGESEILTSKGRTKTVKILRENGSDGVFVPKLYMVDGGKAYRLPKDAVEVSGGHSDFSADMLPSIGEAFSGTKMPQETPWSLLVFPNGTCTTVRYSSLYNGPVEDNGVPVIVGEDDKQIAPIRLGKQGTSDSVYIVPPSTRIVQAEERLPIQEERIITMSLLPPMIDNFTKIRYEKVKVMGANGKVSVSGDKTASFAGATEADCALILVRDYGLSNKDACMLIKSAKAESRGRAIETSYFVEKTAAELDTPPSIGFTQFQNEGPVDSRLDMPSFVEDPKKLKDDLNNAVQGGIKEVFDVTTLKLLVKKTKFFDDIKEAVPLYMQTLDSLCRRLFQFYWHTDKMEKKYGMSKLKKLEEAIKSAIDTLSELTIFFKLRTVDGTGSTGDTATELIGGKMF